MYSRGTSSENLGSTSSLFSHTTSVHKCMFCDRIFTNKGNMEDHIRCHIREQPFQCTTCNKLFARRSCLSTHLMTHRDETLKTHICPHCNKRFGSKSRLKGHMITHSFSKPLSCELCDRKFKVKAHMEVHMRSHTGERPFKCTSCNKTFSTNGVLSLHMKVHLGDAGKVHKCQHCSQTFRFKGNLHIHLLRHTGENPYSCNTCQKSYTTKAKLKRHEAAKHTNEKRYACNQCSYKCYERYSLNIHLNTHMNRMLLQCTICQAKVLHLRTHMKMVHSAGVENIANYVCVFCDQVFKTKEHLFRHLRFHLKEKAYSCEICSQEFSELGNKNGHIKRHHTLEKAETCEYCAKSFFTKRELRNHRLSHIQFGNPHQCDQCEKGFRYSESLLRHKNVVHPTSDMGLRYGCLFCKKRYYRKIELYSHIRMHVRELPYNCELCGKEFSWNSGLHRHIRRIHKDTENKP